MANKIKGSGWVKTPRDLLYEAVFQNANLWHVYCYIFIKAQYQEEAREVPPVGGKRIFLQQGEMIFGRHKCADDISMKPSTVYDQFTTLITLGLIESRTISHTYSIVKVIDYKEKFGPYPFERKELEEAEQFDAADDVFSQEEAQALGLANLDPKDRMALYEPEHHS